MQERGLRVADFAKAIHCNRTNVYDIFTRKSIDIEQLLLISKVLNYDFISEIYLQNKSTKKYVIVAELSEQQLQDLSEEKPVRLIHFNIIP